jgi:hypothetical protein
MESAANQGWSFFSATERLLGWQPTGPLNEEKVQELFEFLCDIESHGGEEAPDKFIDLSQITAIALSFDELRRGVDRRRRPLEQALGRPVKTAFYVNNPVTSGVVRMLHGLLESPDVDLRLFTSKAEAFAWLDADPEALV